MNIAHFARLLRERARLRGHERWSRDELRAVEQSLATVGVKGVAVSVELVDTIPRTALGKAPLIRRASLAAVPAGTH